MRLFDFISVKLTLFLVVGIVIGYYFKTNIEWVAVLLLGSIILLGWSKLVQKRNGFPLFGSITFMTAIVLGIFIISIRSPKNDQVHYSHFIEDGQLEITLKINEVLKSNAYFHRYFATINSIKNKRVNGKILLTMDKDSTSKEFRVDDTLLLFANMEAISPPLNPHQFDYKNYLKTQGVYHQIRAKSNTYSVLKESPKSFFGSVSNFREDLITKTKTYGFGEEQLGVIQALLLGQRNDIREETYNNYRNAGAVHILAVSGLHVGILLLILQFIFRPLERLPKGKTLKLVLILLLLWLYALVAGLSPSIVRAVTMFSFLAYAFHLNRPTSTFNILALSMFFILLINPLFLFQVGFQMSYAAVFAIIWIYPMLQRFWYPKNWLARKTWQLLSVSMAAQLGVLPLSLFYFHQFPALFFISNLVVIPFLGFILGIGIFMLFLAYFNALPHFLVDFYDSIIGLMNTVIGWVAHQEAFVFKDIPFDKVQLVLGYLLVLTLVMAFSKKTFRQIVLCLILVLAYSGYLNYKAYKVLETEKVILAHQSKNTVLFHQKGNHLHVLSTKPKKTARLVENWVVAERIKEISLDTLSNTYQIEKDKFLVVDHNGIYNQMATQVLLSQSPKINLERLLDSIQPKLILADGSNYKSYVMRWKKTCQQRKIPFHYTGEKGAYYFQ